MAADKMIEDIRYLKSGDWIESLTEFVERANGEIQVINYKEFKREFNQLKTGAKANKEKGSSIKAVKRAKLSKRVKLSKGFLNVI